VNFGGQPTALAGAPNGIGSARVPYALGYGELNWTGHYGQYYNLGLTYFGNNNSFNEPPFAVDGDPVRRQLDQVAVALLALAQRLLGLPALRDVDDDPAEAGRRVVAVAHERHRGAHVPRDAALAQDLPVHVAHRLPGGVHAAEEALGYAVLAVAVIALPLLLVPGFRRWVGRGLRGAPAPDRPRNWIAPGRLGAVRVDRQAEGGGRERRAHPGRGQRGHGALPVR